MPYFARRHVADPTHLYSIPPPASGYSRPTPPGRTDMALFLFTRAILEGESIRMFNHGEMWRDFTYIDSIQILKPCPPGVWLNLMPVAS